MSGPRSKKKNPQRDDQVEVEAVELEPTLRGYHVTWNYGTRYWLPFLGPIPWVVWQTLLSFCFGQRDTCWPSISLVADIATGGNRNLVTGRWRGRGSNRRRQPGALDALADAGLLSIQTAETGRPARYTFHVLREPPLLAPDQLAQLPPRLRQLHADLLARCNIDQETYQERVRSFQPLAAPDSTNNYKEEVLIEEIWRTIKEALKLQINRPNYEDYVQDTHATAFDPNIGTLTVEAPDPLVATHLNNYFYRPVLRAIASTNASLYGIPIASVDFAPRHPESQ